MIDIIKLNEYYYIDSDERRCYSKLTALYIAIINVSKIIINMLIENGAAVNIENDHYLSPIHCAVFSGCTETVSLLFRNGAKIDKKSKEELDDEDITEFVDCLEDHDTVTKTLQKLKLSFLLKHTLNVITKANLQGFCSKSQ